MCYVNVQYAQLLLLPLRALYFLHRAARLELIAWRVSGGCCDVALCWVGSQQHMRVRALHTQLGTVSTLDCLLLLESVRMKD
jgi:hypothetical protein